MKNQHIGEVNVKDDDVIVFLDIGVDDEFGTSDYYDAFFKFEMNMEIRIFFIPPLC